METTLPITASDSTPPTMEVPDWPRIQTTYGAIPLDVLIKRFETQQKAQNKMKAKRLDYIQTEEGKLMNRTRAKEYYERHKQTILAKRKAAYQSRKQSPGSSANLSQENSTAA